MKAQAHFLADAGSFGADGTFSIHRGGITDVHAAQWPAMSRFTIFTRLELTEKEAEKLVELTLRFTHEDAGLLGEGRQPLAVKTVPGKPIYVNAITDLQIGIPGPGRITIEAWAGSVAMPLLYLYANTLTTQA